MKPATRKRSLVCKCKTEPRARELASLLNQPGYLGGVEWEDDKVYLHPPADGRPHSAATVAIVREFGRAWSRLINKISV